MKVLGIDIGGSAVKGAPVDTKTGELLAERFRIETPRPVPPKALADLVGEIAAHFKWRGRLGVGFPGVVEAGVVRTAANMDKKFIGCDLPRLLGAGPARRVSAINDADAAGLAEMRFGAGRECAGTVLLLTLGTGVGSALFRAGSLVPNTELGHLPLHGDSAERYMAASVRKAEDLSWKTWAGRVEEYLAVLDRILWPDLIILGGGVSSKFPKFSDELKVRAKLVPAQLLNGAGIVGAALAAKQ